MPPKRDPGSSRGNVAADSSEEKREVEEDYDYDEEEDACMSAVTASSPSPSSRIPRRKRFSTIRWLVQYAKRGKSLTQIVEKIKSSLPSSAETDATPINILCLDGGGMKGYAHTAMFRELLEKAGEDILPYFDLAAGTSVGGVAVLAGSHTGDAERTLAVADTLLGRSRSEAFSKWSCTGLLCKGILLQNDNRANIFQDQFGDKPLLNSDPNHLKAFAVCCLRQTEDPSNTGTMKQPTKYAPFLVRTYEPVHGKIRTTESAVKEETEEKEFLPGTHEIKLWEALTATSSAPLVCGRIEVVVGGKPKRLADGGCVSNSPIAIAIHEAQALWPGRPIGIILSVGLDQDHEVALNRSAVEHAKETSPLLTFVRLRPPIDGFTSFGTDPKKIAEMQAIARDYIRDSAEAQEVLEKLLSSQPRRSIVRRQSFLSGLFHLGNLMERRHSKNTTQRQSQLHFFRSAEMEAPPPPTQFIRHKTSQW